MPVVIGLQIRDRCSDGLFVDSKRGNMWASSNESPTERHPAHPGTRTL